MVRVPLAPGVVLTGLLVCLVLQITLSNYLRAAGVGLDLDLVWLLYQSCQ